MHHFISCIVVVDAGYSPPQQRPTRHSIGHFGRDNPEQWCTSPIQ